MMSNARAVRCAAVLLIAFALTSPSLAGAQKRAFARTVPGAPSGVIAVPMRDAAFVAWLLPAASHDAPPITSYTITAFDTIAPSSVVAATRSEAPGAEVGGLRGNHCYLFRVRAANVVGNGPESDASEAVCLPPAPGADLDVRVSAPDASAGDSDVTLTIAITNNGVADAPMVTLEDNLVAPLSSFTTTQGVCQATAGGVGLRCNLGAIANGASATVSLIVPMNGNDVTTTATVKGLDAAGAPLEDPDLNNNTSTATVHALAQQPSSPQ